MPDNVGRRAANPQFLVLLGVAWIACGAFAFLRLTASWKVIPAIVFVGIGVLFLRGAAVALKERDRR